MAVNAREFNIEMTGVPKEYVKDALRGLLHSIFFHRLLVNVTPRELRIFDIAVAATDSRDVDQLIEERTAEFVQSLTSTSGHARQGKIAVLFYEKRLKKNWFQFSKTEELVCWEQWAITIGLSQPQQDTDRSKALRSIETQLSQNLMEILRLANDHKEHIPSITTTEGNPFPYQIAIPAQSETWGAMLKRLVVTEAPSTPDTAETGTLYTAAAAGRRGSSSSIASTSGTTAPGAGLIRPTSSTSSNSSSLAPRSPRLR
ncbi:hypothetical protein BCR43DRAFT_489493 [Syncephalastrum racemosum]|uniref:Autophagy-related protein 101 n=1 Tax=Syncephalastrum racemosum TaxID=13706 RepID=A0A1X2HE81_SYNRA|nr:hypothetical protein BCR43DRAFT_489493 [Syncephalastrum racemosum]